MNKTLFTSDVATSENRAGGRAYDLSHEQALAQLACTGTLSDTFYATAGEELTSVLEHARACSPHFVGQCAIYAAQQAGMRDIPALLTAFLILTAKTAEDRRLARATFRAVVKSATMVRNVVQIIRSGQLGRKSLATFGTKLVQEWLAARDCDYLFKQSVGNDPSLADVIALAHPKPDTPERSALYGYMRGKDHVRVDLPELVQHFELFKRCFEPVKIDDDKWAALKAEFPDGFPSRRSLEISNETLFMPDVPFRMIDSLPLTTAHWAQLFKNGGYQFVRMNLNTALRQGVFDDLAMVKLVADRLRDREALLQAKQFPYQFLAAYKNINPLMPRPIVDALHDAMEIAIEGVPVLDGDVVVAVDISPSMRGSVTGRHGTREPSKVTSVDVAALFAAAIVRRNPETRVISFDLEAKWTPIEPRDTVLTNAKLLAACGGGTDCSSAIRLLNDSKTPVDLMVLISDDESWLDSPRFMSDPYWAARVPRNGRTGTVDEWRKLKARCPKARQVRIDVTPGDTSQIPAGKDTLLVGGFNDSVFEAIGKFHSGEKSSWLDIVRKIVL